MLGFACALFSSWYFWISWLLVLKEHPLQGSTGQPFCLFIVLQLQRLKRSLSLKSVMRSKSMENFFQRSNAESRLPTTIITSPPPQPSPPPLSESPLAYKRSPTHSPFVSPNLSLLSHSPVSPSLSVISKTSSQAQLTQPVKTHCFQEYVFRRPTNCQTCKHVIQGRTFISVSKEKTKKESSQTL